jgi:hypothetical protein
MAQKPWILLETPGQATEKPWQVKPEGQEESLRLLVTREPKGQALVAATGKAAKT